MTEPGSAEANLVQPLHAIGAYFSRRAGPHWSLLLVAAIGLVLIFTNLGANYLWADEGDTAVLASNILKFGVPKAWDGTTFTDSDYGARENQQLVMVTTPWVQYYTAAASLLIFGKNTFAARLMFAIAGWLTILLVWRLVREISDDWRPAFSAALLIACSVQFLLYARQARYYALSMFFACWLIWIFFRMKSPRQAVLFAIVAILLFHSHPIAGAILAALGLMTLIFPPFFDRRRWFWFSAGPVLLFTLPWVVFARTGFLSMTSLPTGTGEFLVRVIQYLIEVASVTSLIGIAVLFSVIYGRNKLKERRQSEKADRLTNTFPTLLNTNERGLILIIFLILLFYALEMAATQELESMRIIGLRYTSAIIPLLAIAAAILIFKISAGRKAVWLSLTILFVLTRIGQIGPWLCWNPSGVFQVGKYSVATHVSASPINRFVDIGLIRFICTLSRQHPGTMGRSVEVIRQNAQPGDIVITNYESEPLYFYTGLPQGLKIVPQSPIYQAARKLGLPDYVFGLQHARWIIWRFAWDGYFGLTWAQVQKDLLARGARITEMTRVKETFWENRENVHYAHFCGGKHLFGGHHQHHGFPRTRIFRVDYPNGQ